MRALSLRSVTAVLEAPRRNGVRLIGDGLGIRFTPSADDCGVTMDSNFFPSPTAGCEEWAVGPLDPLAEADA
jgi:hypothetical protein